MLFSDVHQGLSEMHRVLKPGGRASVVVFTTLERNPLFAIPLSVICKAVQPPPPAPGQPGLFSLGERGVLEAAFSIAGFREVETHILSIPMRLSSATECVRLERDSFIVLHQMMSSLGDSERQEVWKEIEQELRQFESSAGFSIPAEVIVGVGIKA